MTLAIDRENWRINMECLTDVDEFNTKSIQELLKTVPDPYGGIEVEYTKTEVKFNSKVAACVELINLGFDPFKYANDNNINLNTDINLNIYDSVIFNCKLKNNIDSDFSYDNYDEGSLENITLAVETKKILDELAAKKALEDDVSQVLEKKTKSLEVINNGGKSAFRKSTEIDDFVEKEERPYYKNLKQKLERPEMIELVENYRTTLHEEAND